jgi:hypothetical protein
VFVIVVGDESDDGDFVLVLVVLPVVLGGPQGALVLVLGPVALCNLHIPLAF